MVSGDIWAQRRSGGDSSATTPGKTAVGPWMVESASTSVLTERVIIEAVDIQGRGGDSNEAEGTCHSWFRARLVQRFSADGRGARRGSWALLGPGHSVRPSDSQSGLRMEYREGGSLSGRCLADSSAVRRALEWWREGLHRPATESAEPRQNYCVRVFSLRVTRDWTVQRKSGIAIKGGCPRSSFDARDRTRLYPGSVSPPRLAC